MEAKAVERNGGIPLGEEEDDDDDDDEDEEGEAVRYNVFVVTGESSLLFPPSPSW